MISKLEEEQYRRDEAIRRERAVQAAMFRHGAGAFVREVITQLNPERPHHPEIDLSDAGWIA